jgi:(2Fe-2S) ferredoxin
MYSTPFPAQQQFELIGILKAWRQEPGERAKGFWLETPQGEYLIKLTKVARQLLQNIPTGLPMAGSQVRVVGKCKQKDGKLKLKAQQLQPLSYSRLTGVHLGAYSQDGDDQLNEGDNPLCRTGCAAQNCALQLPVKAQVEKAKVVKAQSGQAKAGKTVATQILICQKSDCCRRGATAIKKAMMAQLAACGLTEQVEIKSTGCLGGCSKGPNLMVMPGKTRLNRLTPADVPLVLADYVNAAG